MNEFAKQAQMVIDRPTPALPRRVELTNLRILKHWDKYYAGDVAGFPADVAAWLVANKIAEPFVTTERRRPLGHGG